MNKIFLFLFLFLLLFAGCATTYEVPKTTVIMFDKQKYEPTNPKNIVIYDSRLKITEKYFEIGAIKYQGNVPGNDIKRIASGQGANAVILEGNNYILIRFYKSKKEKKNDYKKT